MNSNLPVNDISAKLKNKTELYNVLTREGDIFLPPKQDSTQKFLRDIMLGNKLYVKWSTVIITKVPQYKGPQVHDLVRFAESHVKIKDYLPEYEYNKERNREWLCTLINTLIRDEFQNFIDTKVAKRKKELIKNQNLGIKAKPEIVEIFRRSQAVSTMRVKSQFLVRMPTETKDKNLISALKEEKRLKDNKINELFAEIDELKQKVNDMKDEQIDSQVNLDKLANLYKLGIIDDQGLPIDDKMKLRCCL